MREIEFRGKVRDCNEWVSGSLVYIPFDDGSAYCCIMENNCDDEDLPYTNNNSGTFDGSMTPVDKETIGQFTGLCDKNGTKIFEGDILCMTFSNEFTNNEEVKIYKYVKFNDGMFATFYKDEYGEEMEDNRLCKALIEVDKLEVVGNIHDNPDLLELCDA